MTSFVSQGVSWHLLFGRYFFPFDAPSPALFIHIHIPDIQALVALEKWKRRYCSTDGMLCLAVYTLISSGCYALQSCIVVDSLRHSNAKY